MNTINFEPILHYLNMYDLRSSTCRLRDEYIESCLRPAVTTADDFLNLILSKTPSLEETIIEYNLSLHKTVLNKDRLEDCLNFLNRNIWYSVKDVQNITPLEVITLAFNQMKSIITYHPFSDGNKRTGVVSFFFIVQRVFQRIINLELTQQTMLGYSLCKMLEGDDSLNAESLWTSLMLFTLVK